MMRLPHTDNAEAIWAFKKGYRFARQGKPLREMPLSIRTNRELKSYFEQGYQQGQEQLAGDQGPRLTPRKRLIWIALAILAGFATAKLMVDEMRAARDSKPATLATNMAAPQSVAPAPYQAPDQPLIDTDTPDKAPVDEPHAAQPEQPPENTAAPEPVNNTLSLMPPAAGGETRREQPPETAPAEEITPTSSEQAALQTTQESLGLLDEEARAKLAAGQTDTATLPPPVTVSPIQVRRAVLAVGVREREPVGPLGEVVPKSIRRIYFFTEIEGAKGHTLRHRWRYGSRIMAEVPLPIQSDRYRTWSSKRMSTAWAGRWWVEVVDENGQVIARKGFRYVR